MDKRVFYVEKKHGFTVEADELKNDFIENLSVNLDKVRIINRYVIYGVDKDALDKAKFTILSEKTVDNLYEDSIELNGCEHFAVEYLPGQYDQRAEAARECIELITEGIKPEVKYSKIIVLNGNLNEKTIDEIKKYYINPVDSREASLDIEDIEKENINIKQEEKIEKFIDLNEAQLKAIHKDFSLAMTIEDLKLCQSYFKDERRNPSVTEIKVIDTYWSDHCRHTTFLTSIKNIEIENSKLSKPIKIALDEYMKSREFVYDKDRDITLMDIATIAAKELKKKGILNDLDESDEINACTIKANIETDKGIEEYLILFKNETHNHPTEIEPFGGAATCLGGAIRDPLSGRSYVYQAMRVTGCKDPRTSIEDTIKGKLPQRVITKRAAKGYSSYGNEIGLATGVVSEVYHDGFVAKRMEIGAVIGATPRENVRREEPKSGDIVILLGGRTGRDGCGGATGSSKEHTEESINICGSEVQKGNPVVERKIQRFFRNPNVSKMIKRCNDFGAGGVSVAIGELADGLDINLDVIPKKYEGLNGTELAISESQERMAAVIEEKDYKRFIALALEENLEATKVAVVTDLNRMRMFFNRNIIVDLSRDFLNSNGAKSYIDVIVKEPKNEENYFKNSMYKGNFKESLENMLGDLNICSKKALSQRFDSTIGRGSVLMPFGGKYQLTPSEGMAGKIPVLNGDSYDCTLMTYGYNPNIGVFSTFHGAFYAVIESVAKIVSMGGDYKKIHLTFQEYFEKLGKNKEKWGKPFAALLGAFYAQKSLNIAAIGGKDSMSGTFEDLTVPPTLVSFAVALEKVKNVISPEFKTSGNMIVKINTKKDDEEIIDIKEFKKNLSAITKLIHEGKIISSFALRHGGIMEGICNMAFGNKLGIKIEDSIEEKELFREEYGSLLVEMPKEFIKALDSLDITVIGEIKDSKAIEYKDFNIDIDELLNIYEKPLETVFKLKTKDNNEIVENKYFKKDKKYSVFIDKAKPRVFIPVFPGTNCEYDSQYAFENQGAKVNTVVFKNITGDALKESIEEFRREISKSQIIMLPGGFSAGDEPEGSGKFIATVFRNPKIKEEIMNLLNNRDGLILGICNGFQSLIKLGLVPYGEIRDIEENMATLTYNKIGNHMSSIVRTKVVSKLSPWFNEVEIGDVHNIPISHGEGRFVCSEEMAKKLIENGQVATQYVDLNGNVTLDMPYNPNGSVLGIEGITSIDGRILGKMAHSERIGESLYKNVQGNYDQKIFKSGVSYFTR